MAPPSEAAAAAAAAANDDGEQQQPGRRGAAAGEGPSMGILGASALGIFGCGVMAGVYRAQRNEEKNSRKGLKPTEQVKFWRRDGPGSFGHRGDFNPTRYAAKALAVGTVLCLSATGIAAFAIGRAMGVRDVYEFADAVRAWAPRKRRELEAWVGIKPNTALEAERRRVAGMSYDEEMDHWAKVVLAEEERDHQAQQLQQSQSQSQSLGTDAAGGGGEGGGGGGWWGWAWRRRG